MNKYISGLVAAIGFMIGGTFVNAQSVHPVCGNGNEATWQQAIQIDPTLVERRAQMVKLLDQYIQTHNHFNNARTDAAAGANDTIYNIPIVFHIIQDDLGGDNITDDQVRNCVQIMNADYRRQNADTIFTLIPFKPIAIDTRIQFQLATLDPNGNCTDGITRSFSHRTVNFNDFGKSIIDWPSDKYFNIWVVKSISSGYVGGIPGEVIGYAQFPVSGASQTDGVVLRYDFVGNIGAAQTFYAGRDADHETGHYFNLIHTWGDAPCGNDQVDDTPTQYTNTYGCPCGEPNDTCYVFDDSCSSPNPPGIIYQDYMDYTDGDCKNLFTRGQAERMWATLNVARLSLWQPENLSATGTDSSSIRIFDANTVTTVTDSFCPPQADFLPIHGNICPGGTMTYSSNYTNGTPTTYTWSFPGGTPSSFTGNPPPHIQYNAEGSYPVTLTVSNANGSSTITKNNIAVVDYNPGVDSVGFMEGFETEGNLTVPNGWNVFNDDGGPAWQRTNRAAYSGSYSFSVQNYETYANTAPGSWKEFQTPSFNFTSVSKPMLTFYLSYGEQSAISDDSLSIQYSTNCGGTWAEMTHLAGTALAAGSGGLQPNDFAPANQSQWAFVSIPYLSTYKFGDKSDVKFRFLYITGTLSNNIYIDNINITSGSDVTAGINEEQNPMFNFSAVPNPATQSFTIGYLLTNSEDVVINLYDLQGRLVRQLENDHQSPGVHQTLVDGSSFNLGTGLYILKMTTPDGLVSKKLMYSNE